MNAPSDVEVFATFTRELEAELLAAHRRVTRRRRRGRTMLSVAAAVLLAVAVGAFISVVRPSPASADVLRIDRQPDGSVQITVVGDVVDPERMAQELTSAGIANRTSASVTGPSRVGTIITVGSNAGDDINHSARVATLPPGFAAELHITVGVAARGAEPYDEMTSPFDPGEPLAGFERRTDAAAVVAAADARRLRVQIVDMTGTELASVPPGIPVIAAAMTAADTVRLRLAS